MTHARHLTCFTEFPIGLLIVPGDTSPLCCRVPVIYRPLIPLSRALMIEALGVPTIHLRGRLKVLVAECIPSSDIVGRLSRRSWQLAAELIAEAPNATLRLVQAMSLRQLREHLEHAEYDVLVLSAHGRSDGNLAGIMIGDELVLDQELGTLPPVVCLSACSVAPRGSGSVNVADLMLRYGARVVIGTLCPVDVRRNSTLMVRFFVYVADALRGRGPERTLDTLWQFVQMSNAVNDVVSGNQRMSEWAHAGPFEKSVLKEFMDERSVGRIRPGHVYPDTERVLEEIARDRGVLERFRGWLQTPGYIPESLFYVMIGWPERVTFFDPEWAKIEEEYSDAGNERGYKSHA